VIRVRYSIFLILAAAATVVAQQPGVELVLPTTTLEVGEVVNAQLVCTDTGEPSAPTVQLPPGLDLRLTSTAPSVFQQQSIINGRRSSTTTYTFHLRLVAKQAGSYMVGPVTVEAQGDTYQTRPVAVVVRETPADTGPRGDRFLFASVEVEPQKLYVTESYTATLTIGIRKVVIDGREYELDMLRQVLDLGASEISIFAGGQANRAEQWIRDASGKRQKYEVYRVTRQLRAERSGDLEIGPIFLKADYPTAIRRGFFGRAEVSQVRKETARADAVIIKVLDPPTDTRPADFTGAIGRYTMDVTVKPDRIEQGQPVTLTITIQGSPIEGVAGPDLTANAELTSRFEFTQDELVGDVVGATKTFRRALFPRQAGEQSIPPISWSYFDTDRETYVTLKSDPVALIVDHPSQASTGIVAIDTPRRARDTTTLTVVSGGIAPNYVDADLVLSDQTIALVTPSIAATLALPPVLCLLVTVTVQRRRRLQSDRGYARARRAVTKVRKTVKAALGRPNAVEQLSQIAGALSGYIPDRFNLPQASVTPLECADILRAHHVDESLARAVSEFLEKCDALRYAPSTAESLSPQKAADDVRTWVKQLERGA